MMKRVLAAIGIALCSLQFCTAEAPSGEIAIEPNSPVYYLAGDWHFRHEFTAEGEAPLIIDYTVGLSHDSQGRLKGEGMTWLVINDLYQPAAEVVARGSVSGGGDKPTRMTLAVTLKGQDAIADRVTKFNVTLNYTLTIDGADAAGTVRGTARMGKLGTASLRKSDFVVERPYNDTPLSPEYVENWPGGAWVVQMSIVPTGKLGGSGNFVVGPVNLPAQLSGSYSTKKDQGSVNLKGKDQGKGSSAKVLFVEGVPTEISGVVMGQRVR